MTYGHVFPDLHVAPDKSRVKRKKVAGFPVERSGGNKKFNHWQMLQDRMQGMTWLEIGRKHDVSGKDDKSIGSNACNAAMRSSAAYKLKPHEVAQLSSKNSQ